MVVNSSNRYGVKTTDENSGSPFVRVIKLISLA